MHSSTQQRLDDFASKAKKRKSLPDDDFDSSIFSKNQDVWKQLSDVTSNKTLLQERLKNEVACTGYLKLKVDHFTNQNSKLVKQTVSLRNSINSLKSQRLALLVFTCFNLTIRYMHVIKPLVCYF